MEVTAERFYEAMVMTKDHRRQVQGFYAKDAGVHYIRDLWLHGDDQRIWEECENGNDTYEAIHRQMMMEIDIIGYRLALEWLDTNP